VLHKCHTEARGVLPNCYTSVTLRGGGSAGGLLVLTLATMAATALVPLGAQAAAACCAPGGGGTTEALAWLRVRHQQGDHRQNPFKTLNPVNPKTKGANKQVIKREPKKGASSQGGKGSL
jgi:hypothetical protein